MAERYDSPINASPYAFWTNRNVWSNISSRSNRETRNEVNKRTDKKNNDNDWSEVISRTKPLSDHVIATELANNAIVNEDDEIRKNVWSDVDDELYIAKLIDLRTSHEVKREIRDISAYLSDDISEKVVNSDKLEYAMWDLEPTDLTECDCMGPPPEFLLPPPPRPPFLQTDYYCGDDPIPDLETCDTEPVSILSK